MMLISETVFLWALIGATWLADGSTVMVLKPHYFPNRAGCEIGRGVAESMMKADESLRDDLRYTACIPVPVPAFRPKPGAEPGLPSKKEGTGV